MFIANVPGLRCCDNCNEWSEVQEIDAKNDKAQKCCTNILEISLENILVTYKNDLKSQNLKLFFLIYIYI